jgi:hypothetical protein
MWVVVVPWTARNYARLGRVILVSTNGGVNFWIGNSPFAHGTYRFPRHSEINPLYSLVGDEVALDQEGYRLGLAYFRGSLREDPAHLARLYGAKLFYLYCAQDFGLTWNKGSAVEDEQPGTGSLAYALTNLVYVCLALLALVGVGWVVRMGPSAWSGIIYAFYWTAAHLPFFGQNRFMLPLLPVLVTYAAVGVFALITDSWLLKLKGQLKGQAR